jgi:signal transduction histidine kinase
LETVRASAATVLDELGGLLNVLRSPDDDALPVDPAPTLRDLDVLVESFKAAGLVVQCDYSGTPRTVPDSVQLTAFRLIQEGLTNAHKHGIGDALLRLAYTPLALEISVVNHIKTVGAAAGPRSGLGLLGMRERVAAVGGSIEVAPTDDGCFRLVARFPITDASPT